jgi:hypothetical protein
MAIPFDIFLTRGMLAHQEVEEYYRIAKEVYTGKGKIVDLGSFCGASAYSFAAGVRDSSLLHTHEKVGCIYCYDLFETSLPGPRIWLQNNFFKSRDHSGNATASSYMIPEHESFSYLGVFAWQLRELMWMIHAYPGDIRLFKWASHHEIEILMIDLAKTAELQCHVFRHFLPALAVNGILIQQDFHIREHYYIPVAMEYLSPYFEIVEPNCGGSRIYKLIAPIDSHDLLRVAEYRFNRDEEIKLLEASAAGERDSSEALRNSLEYMRNI